MALSNPILWHCHPWKSLTRIICIGAREMVSQLRVSTVLTEKISFFKSKILKLASKIIVCIDPIQGSSSDNRYSYGDIFKKIISINYLTLQLSVIAITIV